MAGLAYRLVCRYYGFRLVYRTVVGFGKILPLLLIPLFGGGNRHIRFFRDILKLLGKVTARLFVKLCFLAVNDGIMPVLAVPVLVLGALFGDLPVLVLKADDGQDRLYAVTVKAVAHTVPITGEVPVFHVVSLFGLVYPQIYPLGLGSGCGLRGRLRLYYRAGAQRKQRKHRECKA